VRATLRRLVANRDPLGRLFDPRNTLAIAATSLVSRMRDTRLVALVTKDAVVDTQREVFGSRSDIDRDRPDLPLRLRLHHDEATLLLDTSGEPLDHRGYRGLTSAASAREQLVAAAILLSGWDGKGPVVDPMCGAGTFLAEAGSIALGWSPARLRKRFAFEGFTGFEPATFDAIRREPIPTPGPEVRLFGVDNDPVAIDAARVSLQRAGLAGRADLQVGDAFAIDPPPGPPGLVCFNPPWGERLGESEDLWRRIGDLLKQRFKGWRAVLLAGDARMGAGLGLRARKFPVRAGAAELRILVVELY
jgi:putative N6-adenine-specific DNA methylase